MTVKEAWTDWMNPSPIAKHSTTVVFFIIAAALTAMLPGEQVQHGWAFLVGLALQAVATVVAAVISSSRRLWRYELVVPWLTVLSIASLRVATDSGNTPIIALALFPALWFAGGESRFSLLWVTIGGLVSLVVPVLVDPHPDRFFNDLGLGVFGTAVLLAVGYIFHEAFGASRKQVRTLNELADVREARLKETIEYSTQLEKSEVERRAAERMLRGVWAAVTEQAVIGTDLDGVIDAWNPGAEKLLGPSAREVEYATKVTEFHVPAELHEYAAELKLATSAGDSNWEALVHSARSGEPDVREWTYVRRDGTVVPVQVSVTARLDEEGHILGFLFVANDLTTAKEAAKLKDDFVGLISHELRTPLSSILGYLELLRDDDEAELSDSQLQYLGVAERNANRLLRLVGDLLFTAQVESGVFQLDAKTVDLATIMASSLESARPVANTAGISMQADLTEGVLVAGDPVRLGQSVDNLISNAIKFTPRGGVVTISLSTAADEAIVRVSDTGVGIPAGELDKLFSRFFRATTATNNAVPGVGLGLTITKAIVTAHHGRMGVDSEEGAGTSFSIYLPLVAAHAETVAP